MKRHTVSDAGDVDLQYTNSNTNTTKRLKLNETFQSPLLSLPIELFTLVIDQLTINDIKSLSLVNRSLSSLVANTLYSSVAIPWDHIEHIAHWKKNSLIRGLRIKRDTRPDARSEWNISIKGLFKCPNLTHITIELIASSRCIKYKDDFNSNDCSNIKSLTLISNVDTSIDYSSDKALFETIHINKFTNLNSINLQNFTLGKDIYSEFNDNLINLKNLTLINCVWLYPLSIPKIFSSSKPVSIIIKYNGDATRFISSERFRALVNKKNNSKWLIEKNWWLNVKCVVIDVGDSITKPEKSFATVFDLNELPNLVERELIGWR